MKRNAKIIQINGLRGLVMAMFILTCLVAGFVIFPGFVAMNVWNTFATFIPKLNIYQGVLLWSIIAFILFVLNKQTFSVTFASPKELNDEEMSMLMERIKMDSQAKMFNKMMLENLEKLEKEEVTETVENKETEESSEK